MSYISILRNNRDFRLLYIGQTISQLGDWFNAVAVYARLLDLTGSATAVVGAQASSSRQSRWKEGPVEAPEPIGGRTAGEEDVIESRIG